jgi:hypothetical protein
MIEKWSCTYGTWGTLLFFTFSIFNWSNIHEVWYDNLIHICNV